MVTHIHIQGEHNTEDVDKSVKCTDTALPDDEKIISVHTSLLHINKYLFQRMMVIPLLNDLAVLHLMFI